MNLKLIKNYKEIDGHQTASHTFGAENERAMMEVGTSSSPDRTIYLRELNDHPLVEMGNSGSSRYTAKRYIYDPTGLLETKPNGSGRELNTKTAYGYMPFGEESRAVRTNLQNWGGHKYISSTERN